MHSAPAPPCLWPIATHPISAARRGAPCLLPRPSQQQSAARREQNMSTRVLRWRYVQER
ncbi:hypothetical protein BC834DRAFT_894290 [Gloeopeniophorella convolvens]|nr:hypothetical protein BC834DRAFT_894290 [Gloeopeniophorella convolvens]